MTIEGNELFKENRVIILVLSVCQFIDGFIKFKIKREIFMKYDWLVRNEIQSDY